MTETGPDQSSILVAIDLSAAPGDLDPVVDMARQTGRTVHLVHAVQSPEQRTGTAKVHLAELVQALAQQGIEAEIHLPIGPAVDVIFAAAEQLGSTMIVVAGHRRQVEGFTSALLQVTVRPVLVLPSGDPTHREEFEAAVDRLIEIIEDEDDAPELAELRDAARVQLGQPASTTNARHLGTRLSDALHRFETSHPTLTAAINDVSYHLSGLGV